MQHTLGDVFSTFPDPNSRLISLTLNQMKKSLAENNPLWEIWNALLRENTIKFGNLNHSQKLKRIKQMTKNKNFIEDEPFLNYNNQIVPKNEALADHFAKINGPIKDPESNPNKNEINAFNKNLDSFMYNTLEFTAMKPKEKPNDNAPPPLEAINNPINVEDDVDTQIPHYDPKYISPTDSIKIELTQLENESDSDSDDDDIILNDISHPTRQHIDELVNNNPNTNDKHAKFSSVEMALSFANNNSAPGYDGLKAVHLHLNSLYMNQILCEVFNVWNCTYIIPNYCRIGSIVSILKVPDGNTPNQYRPITLLPIRQ